MSFSIDQTITKKWNEWKSGFIEEIEGLTFMEVIVDKSGTDFRLRLVFEQDANNQHIVNQCYATLPTKLDIVYDALGRKVKTIQGRGTKEYCHYEIAFEDGYWFTI